MEKNLFFYLHILMIIIIFSIPFFPIKYLQYLIFLPTMLYITWNLFDGCPWTKLHSKKEDEHFTLYLLKEYFPKITKEQVEYRIGLCLNFVLLISFYKLLKNNKKITIIKI